MAVSGLTWVIYALISVLLFLMLNTPTLWRLVLGDDITIQAAAPLTDKLVQAADNLATPIVFLFWLLLGVIAYLIIWLLENFVFIAKTEVTEAAYRRGGLTPHKQYWSSALLSNLFLLTAVLVWVGGIAVYIQSLLPQFTEWFQEGLVNGSLTYRLTTILAAVALNSGAIYLILLLKRTLVLAWRLNRPA